MLPRSSVLTPIAEENDWIPHEFLCPINQSIMRDPILTKSGHSFERMAIIKWICRQRYLSHDATIAER